ncbi:MAG: tetratricopeptide repeat protein [Chitinivibrionales bacterium]|nr:tetratricopeptide repeat protein [Chitinivibrionales bacterium]
MRKFHVITILWCIIAYSMNSWSDETLDKLIKGKKYKEAIEHADQNIAPPNRSADEWVQIARANEQLGLTEKALACYLVSSRVNPKHYESFLGAARIYNKLGQHENALTNAKKALELNFTGDASWQYANACIKLDRSAEAKKALEKVIETDPDNIVANRELGNIYFNDKEYSKAIPLLQKAYEKKANADVAYKIGKSYLETGNTQSAIDYLNKTLKEKPGLHQARLDLARTYYQMGNYKDAIDEYEKSIDKAKSEPKDKYHLAISKEKTGDSAGAYKAYNDAIKAFGADRSKEALLSRLTVAKAQLNKKQYQEALGHLKFINMADKEGKIAPDIYFLLADAYEGLKKISDAITSLKKAIEKDEKNIEAYARLADLYKRAGNDAKAKETYEKMISLSPNDPNVYLILGNYNLKADNYTKAMELFQKSNTLQKSGAALEGIAISSAKTDRWDRALDAAESAIRMDPNLQEARKVLAKALMKESNYAAAIQHYEKLANKNPKEIEYWRALAICYEKTQNREKLANADKQIIKLDSKDVPSRLRYGKYLLSKKEDKKALKIYQELATLAPKNAAVFKNLYLITKRLGDKNKSLTYVNKYLELNPKDAEAYRDKGNFLYEKKDLDGALAAYRTALKLDPTISGFYDRYAEIVIAKGQHDEAIRAIKGKIKSGNATVEDYTTLGMIYQKKKSYKNAVENYQKALQMNPQKLDVLTALGECQAAMGQIKEAIITYEQVIMMNPKASKEYKALGDLYAKQNQDEQALKAYKKYLDSGAKDNAVARKIAMIEFNKKNYKDAVKYFGMVSGKEADEFGLKLAYGEACYHAGQYQKAIDILSSLKPRNPSRDALKTINLLSAKSYEKLGEDAKAAQEYLAYTKISGVRDEDAAYKVALLQEKTNPSAAIKQYEINIAKYPKDYRNYLQLGLLYSDKKETLNKSIAMFKKITAMADSFPVIWEKLGDVYGKLGKEDEELNAYKNYVKKEPQDTKANKRIGVLLVKKGKYKEGLIYLETASTLAPKDVEIMYSLAHSYAKTNRPNEAISVLTKAKELKPRDTKIRNRLYKLYMKVGKEKEAREEVEQLLAIDPNDVESRMVYAELLFQDKKYKEAENEVENIMATSPGNDVLMLLGKIKTAQKKYKDALTAYDEIIAMENYAPALYEKAELFRSYGKELGKSPKWAETFYKRALRSDSTYALAELGLARLQKLWKRDDLYRKHLRRAKELDPTNDEIQKELKKAR